MQKPKLEPVSPKETAGSKIRRALGGRSRRRKKSDVGDAQVDTDEYVPCSGLTSVARESQDDVSRSGPGLEKGLAESDQQGQAKAQVQTQKSLGQLARRVASKAALMAIPSTSTQSQPPPPSSLNQCQSRSCHVDEGSNRDGEMPQRMEREKGVRRRYSEEGQEPLPPAVPQKMFTSTVVTTPPLGTVVRNLQVRTTSLPRHDADWHQADRHEHGNPSTGSSAEERSPTMLVTPEVSSAVDYMRMTDEARMLGGSDETGERKEVMASGQLNPRQEHQHQRQPRAAVVGAMTPIPRPQRLGVRLEGEVVTVAGEGRERGLTPADQDAWRKSDSTIGKHTVLLSAAGLVSSSSTGACRRSSLAAAVGPGSRPVSMADSVQSTASTIVPAHGHIALPVMHISQRDQGQSQRLSWVVGDLDVVRMVEEEIRAGRSRVEDDDEDDDYEQIPPATPEKDAQFLPPPIQAHVPVWGHTPPSPISHSHEVLQQQQYETSTTPVSTKRKSDRRSMSLSVVTSQAAQALLSKSKSRLLRSPVPASASAVPSVSTPSSSTSASPWTASATGGGYVAVQIASGSGPATPMKPFGCPSGSSSTTTLDRNGEDEASVGSHKKRTRLRAGAAHTGGGRSKMKTKETTAGLVPHSHAASVSLKRANTPTMDVGTGADVDEQIGGVATPSPARQTASAVTAAGGLAKRAVEKMGRAVVGLGMNHGHSYSYSHPGSVQGQVETMRSGSPSPNPSTNLSAGSPSAFVRRSPSGSGGGRRGYASPSSHHRWKSTYGLSGTTSRHQQPRAREEEAPDADSNKLVTHAKNPNSKGGTIRAGVGRRLRRTPNAPSMSSVRSNMTSVSASGSVGDSESPRLGKQLRGSLGVVGSKAKQKSKMKGVVFGRDLEAVVRDTRVGVGFGEPELQLHTEFADVNELGVLVIQPDTSQQVEDQTKEKKEKFKEQLKALETRKLPAVVVRCAQHLLIWGVQEEGLFRVNGRSLHISTLRAEFDSGADFDMTECGPADLDPHSVSSLFKAFIRELPEPVLTHALSPYFDAALNQDNAAKLETEQTPAVPLRPGMRGPGLPMNPRDCSSSSSNSIHLGGMLRKPPSLSTLAIPSLSGMRQPSKMLLKALKSLLAQLPKENRDLIRTVTDLIRATAGESRRTKMPLSNLLLVFCPSLNMSPPLLKVLCEAEGIWGDEDEGEEQQSLKEKQEEGEEGELEENIVFDIGPGLPSSVLDLKSPFADVTTKKDLKGEEAGESACLRSSEDNSVAYLGSVEDGEAQLTDDSSCISQSMGRNCPIRDHQGPEGTSSSILMDDQSSYVSTSEDQESSWPPVLTSSTSTDSLDTPESTGQHPLLLPLPPASPESVPSFFPSPKPQLVPGVVIAHPDQLTPIEMTSVHPHRPILPPPVSYSMPQVSTVAESPLIFPSSTSEVRLVSVLSPFPAASEKSSNRRSMPRLSLPSLPSFPFRNNNANTSTTAATTQPSPQQTSRRAKKKPSLHLRFAKKGSSSSSPSSLFSPLQSRLQSPETAAPGVVSPDVLSNLSAWSSPSTSQTYVSAFSANSLEQRRASSESSMATPVTARTTITAQSISPLPKLDMPLVTSPLKFTGYGFGLSPPLQTTTSSALVTAGVEAEMACTENASSNKRLTWKKSQQQPSTPADDEHLPQVISSVTPLPSSSSSSPSFDLPRTTMTAFSLVGESHYPDAGSHGQLRPTLGRSGLASTSVSPGDHLTLLNEPESAEDWTRTVLVAASVDKC